MILLVDITAGSNRNVYIQVHTCLLMCKIWSGEEGGRERVREIIMSLMATIVNQGLRLNGDDIKRSSGFCYLGSTVAENGGTSRNANARIQKARGSFSKLRRVLLSKSLQKDTRLGYLMPV